MNSAPTNSTLDFFWLPLRRRARWTLAVSTALAALAHIPVLGQHLREAPYMGVEFAVLILGYGLIAVGALVCDSAALYLVTLATCGLAIAGYAATHIVAFPELADDVNNWFEPLGIVAVAAETTAVAAALVALASVCKTERSQPPQRVVGNAVAAQVDSML